MLDLFFTTPPPCTIIPSNMLCWCLLSLVKDIITNLSFAPLLHRKVQRYRPCFPLPLLTSSLLRS